LGAMLDQVDMEISAIDSLKTGRIRAGNGAVLPTSPRSRAPADQMSTQTQERPAADSSGKPQWQLLWVQREGEPTGPATSIPQLPEAELPPTRALSTLPEGTFTNWPPELTYVKDLPNSDIIQLPDSEVLGLPQSGEFFGRPNSGEMIRIPGEEESEDYAYPDTIPEEGSAPGKRYGYQLKRRLSAGEDARGFNPDADSVGDALHSLAARLNKVGTNESLGPTAGLEEQIADLYARMLQLRARIANAIALYENHARVMALEELDRRQLLLEVLLEQASLELAKTYDQSSNR
jgi:hypothetical protein